MRGELRASGLTKAYQGVPAVRDVTLDVAPGELVTLLGRSGCGKTTLLRLVAGFERPDAGTLSISGRDMTSVPPHLRPVHTVFQHYALFPHRTVAGNVGFGLELRGLAKLDLEARVERALERVRLGGLGARGVHELSGGQKQRVALARALVLEPEVLLLDEPMVADRIGTLEEVLGRLAAGERMGARASTDTLEIAARAALAGVKMGESR